MPAFKGGGATRRPWPLYSLGRLLRKKQMDSRFDRRGCESSYRWVSELSRVVESLAF